MIKIRNESNLVAIKMNAKCKLEITLDNSFDISNDHKIGAMPFWHCASLFLSFSSLFILIACNAQTSGIKVVALAVGATG